MDISILENGVYSDKDLKKMFGIMRDECRIAIKKNQIRGRYMGKSGYRFLGISVARYIESRGGYVKLIHYNDRPIDIPEIKISKPKIETKNKKGIPLVLRWRVLTRDKFTCQYCGRKAPEVPLEIDHVIPFSKGGETTEVNLRTACKECNRGKTDSLLDYLNSAPIREVGAG